MKRSKEELLDIIKMYIGDRNDDETISLIEDITDTIESESVDIVGMKEEYERKIAEKEAEWRKRYTDRFFEKTPNEEVQERTEDVEETKEIRNYSDLFE